MQRGGATQNMSLAKLRLTPKQLRFQADYVIMHNLIEQLMVLLISVVNVLARTVYFQQPIWDAIGQAFSLAAIQLVMEFGANGLAMYYEAWAGVPVVEVWVLHRWRVAGFMLLFVAFT
jgi:hypothetical protein